MSDALARALAYPFSVPRDSYVYLDGAPVPWEDRPPVEEADRVRVLSYGANATVEALRAKLGAGVVPVRRAMLGDFDAVYSAHISPYGAIPAALQRSPGTRVTVFVLSLTAAQLAQLHPTEPNYRFVELAGLDLRTAGETLPEVAAYVSRHGCLRLDDGEVAVAAVAAERRRFPALAETEVLDRVRTLLAPDRSLEEFVDENVAEPELAARRTAVLRADARPLDWRVRDRAGV
jgi:hypothetical protein